MVSQEELEKIKKEKREIEKRFKDLKGLERTLVYIKYSILLEHRNRLRAKLKELTEKHRELSEFEVKARRDKEFLMRVRLELSEENARLRRMLEARK